MENTEKMEEIKVKVSKTLATMLDYLALDAKLKIEDKGSKLAVIIASEDAGRIIGRKGQTLESLQLLLNRMMFNAEPDCPRIVLDIDGYSRNNNRPGGDEEGEGDDRGDRRDRGGDRGGDRRDRRDRGDRGDRRDDRGGDRRDSRGGRDRNEEDEAAHEETLRIQALDASKEVKRWGEPVVLAPMNSHDRRIIHITLQDDPELITASEGEGSLKKVVISVKK
ncbi:MAG: R3H domain-containing nucleic acid-binding protein [Lentisphaerota bacterium]